MTLLSFLAAGLMVVLLVPATFYGVLRWRFKADPSGARILSLIFAAVIFGLLVVTSPFLQPVPWILYIVMSATVILGPATYLTWLFRKEDNTADTIVTWVVVVVVSLVLCLPTFINNYATETKFGQAFVLMDVNGKPEFRYPKTWGAYECRGCIILPYSDDRATVGVTPITQNPKARHIEIQVHSTIVDYRKYLLATGNPASDSAEESADDRDRFQRAIRRELNEVTNAYSKELAEFYNPDDDDQHRRLETFILTHVNPRLAPKGIKVTGLAYWSVN